MNNYYEVSFATFNTTFESLRMKAVLDPSGIERWRDPDIAAWLGYARPIQIRKLIRREWAPLEAIAVVHAVSIHLHRIDRKNYVQCHPGNTQPCCPFHKRLKGTFDNAVVRLHLELHPEDLACRNHTSGLSFSAEYWLTIEQTYILFQTARTAKMRVIWADIMKNVSASPERPPRTAEVEVSDTHVEKRAWGEL